MRLTMLGTGHAMVTECYNTCYVFQNQEGGEGWLVDGGGGNTILKQLKAAKISPLKIHTIFVTHKHIDHLLGIVWILRSITSSMRRGTYEGNLIVYSHAEVLSILKDLVPRVLQNETELLQTRVSFIEVQDGTTVSILDHPVTFFDIHSTKATQFGYRYDYAPNQAILCCGDEPYNPCILPYAQSITWLFHEAFCLERDSSIYHPHEIHHSTVLEAAMLANTLHADHLLLYHTEDQDLAHRKVAYTKEATSVYSGTVVVPEDLEVVEL